MLIKKLTNFIAAIIYLVLVMQPCHALGGQAGHADLPQFSVQVSGDGVINFTINLTDGYKMLTPFRATHTGFTTEIDISESTNLKARAIKWPGDSSTEYYTGQVLSIPVLIELQDTNLPLNLRAKISYLLCKEQCFPLSQTINMEFLADQLQAPKNSKSLLLAQNIIMILLAIGGGFILNFMPCVLPVLSLKVISILKHQDRKHLGLGFTVLGIMSSFLALALITVILKHFGKQFGLGVHFQHPEFIIIISALITVLISVSLDRVHIKLPIALNKLFMPNHVGSNVGYFIDGVLAATLSTPCTAPFLGSAMALALAGNNITIVTFFLATGAGFSLPYFVLMLHPPLLSYLPKPGKWMHLFKMLLAFLLTATLLWLLSVLYGQSGVRATFCAALLLLLLKFVIENKARLFVKVCLCIAIFTGALLLPQLAYIQDLEQQRRLNDIWQEFDNRKIYEYVAQGKVVVVDVTADWCVTCKFNKIMVLTQNRAMQLLSSSDVIAMKADYTRRNPQIHDYLIHNHVYGIPFNKVYGPNPPHEIILPVLLSYKDLERAINQLRRTSLTP